MIMFIYLFVRETEFFCDTCRELAVRLVEHRVRVIRRFGAHGLEQLPRGGTDVLEIGRFAGETPAVARIRRAFPSPEVWRVRRETERPVDLCYNILRTEKVRRAAGRRRIFQSIAGRAL